VGWKELGKEAVQVYSQVVPRPLLKSRVGDSSM
jgi:hypothetical protein